MPLNALQMPIYALTDVTGLVEWIDYIPAQVETAGRAGSTDDDGYLQSVNVLSDNTGLVAWVDYIPVYEVTGRTKPWYAGSDGYIPYNEIGSVVAWSPSALFAAGEVGAWYDPSDLTTMWTDDGTTQAGVGDLVYRIDDKSGNGNHARQTTEARRPILRQDVSGNYYLEFDGSDDYLITGTIDMSASDAMTAAYGLDLEGASGPEIIGELGQSNSAGEFGLSLNASRYFSSNVRGSSFTTATGTDAASGSYVVTQLGDISGDVNQIRLNGSLYVENTGDLGTGNLASASTFQIGARGTVYYIDGKCFSIVIRNALTSGDDLTNLESYVAGKTGVTLA